MTSISDFEATSIDGVSTALGDFSGRVLLVVNTASKCGFTPQYRGLEQLHRDYGARGFEVLGFPCNQFGHQEPGDAHEIRSFCSLSYDVSFPMFARIDVNGDAAHPLFRWLKQEAKGVLGTTSIKWNFTKFLIDRSGRPVDRFSPTEKPEALRPRIEALI